MDSMHDDLLPLFPLAVVLLPHNQLPLHIFEDRYKQMFAEILKMHSEFGVVRAGEKGIVNTGCTATIEKILKRYPDGRLDLLAIGRRRFEIFNLNDERPYLRGSVEFYDDDEEAAVTDEVKRKAMAGFRELRAMEDAMVWHEPEINDPQLSFQIAQVVPDLDFRQVMLATRSETERMQQLIEFLPGFIVKQRRITHVRDVAPRNGHAEWSGR
jgi:Lon protease-like protein